MFHTITKEFTFSCAHMLEGHMGLSRNLHGHTYTLQVTVAARNLLSLIEAGPSEGMIVDFKDLNTIVKGFVLSKFDHAFIYNRSDAGDVESKIAILLMESDLSCYDLCMKPTVEHMVVHIFNLLVCASLNSSWRMVKARLYETPSSFAEFGDEDYDRP